jgi:hypothetical protein
MLVKLNLLVVADRTDLFAVAVNFLGFEAFHAVGGAEFADLKAGQNLGVADDKFAVEVNLDDGSEMLLVVDFDFLLIANDAHVPGNNFCPEALDSIPGPKFSDL